MQKIFQSALVFSLLVALIAQGTSSTASAAEGEKKRLLVLTQSVGFRHGPVTRKEGNLALSEKVLAEIGEESGLFETVSSQEADKVITADNLKDFDAVLFYTTGELPLSNEQKEALLSFIRSGKGFLGVHSATDTFHNYDGYYRLINGTFNGHPWNAGNTVTITNHEPAHPTVAMFDREFQFKDEIYQYKNYDPTAVRVLLSLDMAKTNPKMPYHVPVCWVREYGQGRLFYTNLGHNESSWQNPKFRQHLLAGFRFATKMDSGNTAPNPDVQAVQQVRSFLAVATDELLAKAAKKDSLQQISKQIDELKPVLSGNDANKRHEARDKIVEEIEK